MAIHLVLAVTRESAMLRITRIQRQIGEWEPLDSGKEGSGVP